MTKYYVSLADMLSIVTGTPTSRSMVEVSMHNVGEDTLKQLEVK